MKTALIVLLGIHGAICTFGFVKAFGLAELPMLSRPIIRPVGVLWLMAGVAFVIGAVLLLAAPRYWWIAAAPAVVLSQALIIASWHDARFGTLANALVIVPLLLALLDLRPSSLRSRYRAEVEARATDGAPAALVTEADLAPLPALVSGYLRRVGVVGRPRVQSFQAVFRAQMRSRPDAPWMTASAEQVDFFGEPARLFFMQASRSGVPFHVFHRYVGEAASMQVRVVGLIDVVDVKGPEISQSETVTLFNDMCFFAPSSLLDARVTWQPLDPRHVRGVFSNGAHTIAAVLEFDQQGDLVGFVSQDRYQSDGKTHRLLPWSTPSGDYRDFGGFRLAAQGEARWREPPGEWIYGRFELLTIHFNRSGGGSTLAANPLARAGHLVPEGAPGRVP